MVTPPTAPALARHDVSQARKPRKTVKGYPRVMPTRATVPLHSHGPRRSTNRSHDRKRLDEAPLGKHQPPVRPQACLRDGREIEDGAGQVRIIGAGRIICHSAIRTYNEHVGKKFFWVWRNAVRVWDCRTGRRNYAIAPSLNQCTVTVFFTVFLSPFSHRFLTEFGGKVRRLLDSRHRKSTAFVSEFMFQAYWLAKPFK